MIIDGIGPLIAANEHGHEANVERFKTMLENDLRAVARVLQGVWVLGDLTPPPPREELANTAVIG